MESWTPRHLRRPEPEPDPDPPSRRWGLVGAQAAAYVAIIAVLATGVHLLFIWLRTKGGVDTVGDEPAYLTAAQAILHGTWHTTTAFRQDLARHYFSAFPPGAKLSRKTFEYYLGPRGAVSPFEPGLALVIAPGLALGGQGGAFVGLFVVEAAGLLLIHRRLSGLCGLAWRAQVFLALVLVSPAVAVASTQLYPDLLSGIVLAAGLAEVARRELRPAADRWSTVIAVVAVAVLPWLQVKNVVPAGLLAAAFALVCWRRRQWSGLVALGVVLLVAWGLLVAYNLVYFGHLLGFPEASPGLNHAGWVRTLGLLFDRDQGLFVQLPTAALGLLGAWFTLRRAPFTVAAAVLGVAAIIALNGTYVTSWYGGVTLAGRFEWTAMPVVAGFGAFALQRWQEQGWALLRGAVVLAAAWAYQGVGVVDRAHATDFFTQLTGWDPQGYAGWWPHVDGLLPDYVLHPALFGRPATGTVLVVVAAFALVTVPSIPVRVRPPAFRAQSLGAGVLLVGLVVVFLAVDPGTSLPKPLSYAPAAVGSPMGSPVAPVAGTPVALQGVAAGRYRLSASYTLAVAPGPAPAGKRAPVTPAPATLVVDCDRLVGGRQVATGRASLSGPSGTAAVTIRCPSATAVAAAIRTPLGTRLVVQHLVLTKVGS